MHLITGLGNPGAKYARNRHNIGFLVIDEMTKDLETTNINRSNFQAEVLKSNSLVLVKPTTYMNNSGVAVSTVKKYYKIENPNIIIIHDDLDLPYGTIKFKIGGGHGGHNGLRSIDAHIGNDYIRVRIGIGKPENKENVANYVLSDFSKEESNKLQSIISHTIESIEALKSMPIDEVKSKYTIKI